MANTVQIRNSSTAAAVPSSLEAGELAINTADAKLFWEDSAGSIQTTYLQPNLGDLADVSDTVPSPNTSVYVLANVPGVGWSSQGTIGSVSVGSEPLGGWPAGSVGESLDGKASTSHASTHATGGSDAIAPADIDAAPAASPTFSGTVTSGGKIKANLGIQIDSGLDLRGTSDAFPGETQAAIHRTGSTGSAPFNQAGSLVYRPRVSSVSGRSSHIFYTGSPSTERLRIDESGTAIFSGVITVSAGSAAAPAIVATGDSNTGIAFDTDTLIFSTDGNERLRIDSSGNVGIDAASPTAKLDINADTIRLRTAKTPASSSDTGNAGDICWDSSYLYICTATDTWRRIAHSTW